MAIQTAIWVPPTLCDCKFQITADWAEGSIVNGVSHKHPLPFTITDIKALNICADHIINSQSMIDTSAFFDVVVAENDPYKQMLSAKYSGIVPASIQNRGYLKYPIDNPTPAEYLYTFFTYYTNGQVLHLPCGCSAYHCVEGVDDTSKTITALPHPVHGKKCQFHHNDTVDMQNARADHDEIQAVLKSNEEKAEAVADLAPAA